MMPEAKVAISGRISPELHETLKKLAASKGVSFHAIMDQALRDYAEREVPQKP